MGRLIEVTEKMRILVAIVAKFSQSKRLKVGAVIFKPSIEGWLTVCSGHNKHPKGLPMEYAEFGEYDPYDPKDPNVTLITHPDVIHAELSAIRLLLAADYNLESRKDMLLVSTHSPCLECAKLIYASGIQTVRFGEYYRDKAGVEFLKMMGVDVEQWSDL
jgi:dCMP deaminase